MTSKKLEWVANDWAKPDPINMGGVVVTVQQQKEWRRQYILGDPQATKTESVESLKAMGMIGLYKEVLD